MILMIDGGLRVEGGGAGMSLSDRGFLVRVARADRKSRLVLITRGTMDR